LQEAEEVEELVSARQKLEAARSELELTPTLSVFWGALAERQCQVRVVKAQAEEPEMAVDVTEDVGSVEVEVAAATAAVVARRMVDDEA
jgi:hypothetical protein